MSFEAYNNAITRLANEELAGEDIQDGIAALASIAGRDQSSIRHDITERSDLLKD